MTLLTPWGEALDRASVLPEYPRPQLVRDSYLNLNGVWDYAIVPGKAFTAPAAWDGEIVVPFSPEAPLSGVERQLMPGETLWYRRTLTLPDGFTQGRVLLHFGAVDERCRVYLDGVEVGSHQGGYLPFTVDVTEALEAATAEITVAVHDDSDTASHSRGKQKLKRGGIWYTAQSGIWQTVWLESVPPVCVERLVLTPQLADSAVDVLVEASAAGSASVTSSASVTVSADGVVVAVAEVSPGVAARLPIADIRAWSPEHPFLYDVTVTLGDDTVTSYFGMRSFGVGPDASGTQRLLLNGEPYFHAGVLDQGYWPDGLYTPPSDEAMIYDIQTMKDLGFTMLRKHIKIEPMRWYHHCDRLGMLVWQDAVNGGSSYNPAVITIPAVTPLRLNDKRYRAFGRADAGGREQFRRELRDTVELLRSVPSIALWVPFNEGWGQFDALDATRELRQLDPTRPVDHASGWHDQGGGDLHSLHVYFRAFRAPRSDGRVLALTEYGGYSLRIPGHEWGSSVFGYKRFDDPERFADALVKLHEEQIAPAIAQGLSATVYTQLSDVEDEINGLLSYDRRVLKAPAERIRAVTAQLRL